MRIIPFILYLFLLAFHNSILSDMTSILGARIDLAVLIVALVALYKSEVVSLWFALMVGIIMGTLRLDLMPWEMLVLGASSLMTSQVRLRVNLDSMTTRMIILAALIFIHQVIISLIISASGILYASYKMILPAVIFTLIPGWLYFQFKDGNITWGKIRSLF